MNVFKETIIISFVILALTISMGRVLAKKNGTPLDPSTELRALGLSNIAGSFYGCIPSGCAMARTMVLAGIGAPTQLTNFIGSTIVFTVLQWLGSLLEPLPAPVLASIVIVAVKPLFLTVKECWRLLHVSWVDAVSEWTLDSFSSMLYRGLIHYRVRHANWLVNMRTNFVPRTHIAVPALFVSRVRVQRRPT